MAADRVSESGATRHAQSVEDVLDDLRVDPERGLSADEVARAAIDTAATISAPGKLSLPGG